MQYQPQGRLSKLDDLRLLRVDEALYIPVTQEPAPMTEDQLEAHAEVLTRLASISKDGGQVLLSYAYLCVCDSIYEQLNHQCDRLIWRDWDCGVVEFYYGF